MVLNCKKRGPVKTRDGQIVGIPIPTDYIPIPRIPKYLGKLQNSQKNLHSHSHSFPWKYCHSHEIPEIPKIPNFPIKKIKHKKIPVW